jgi:hypothetical protein
MSPFKSALFLCSTIGFIAGASAALKAQQRAQDMPAMPGMTHMAGHMYMTTLQPLKAGDQQKADVIAATARQAMEPYRDYHKALADGYQIFLPNVPQPIYHFTKAEYGLEARQHFDASKPTSLLYKKTADGGYELVGAMYTDRVSASEDELNDRIPLSVARWHQHVNFCKAPAGQWAANFGPDAKFGLMGSITTKDQCDAAGGDFYPHIFGWMVHVYPYETDPKKIWSTDDDDMDTTTWIALLCRGEDELIVRVVVCRCYLGVSHRNYPSLSTSIRRGVGRSSMEKAKSPFNRSAIPLDHAVLCLDCNCVSDANRQCPACSSRALMNLSVVLNRRDEVALEQELAAA